MTVREMIEILSTFDPNLTVRITMNQEYESDVYPEDFGVFKDVVTWGDRRPEDSPECLYIGDVN